MANGIIYGPKSTVPKIGLGQFFFQCLVQNHGEKICQVDIATGEKETYTFVKQRSVRAAIVLASKGITPEDVVCFCTNNSIDNTIATLGTLFLGAKVASLDPQLSEEQTRHLLSIVAPKVIFVQESCVILIEESLKLLKINPQIVVFGHSDKYDTFDEFQQVQSGENGFKPAQVDAEKDIGIIFFSSGSTGLPKAICHTHYSFVAMLFNSLEDVSSCILHFSTMYWISAILLMSLALKEGGTRAFFSRPMSTKEIVESIGKYKISSIFMGPLFTYELTAFEDFQKYDTSSLKFILTGGTDISPHQIFRLEELFENLRVLFLYGTTESGIISAIDKNLPTSSVRDKIEAGTCGKIEKGFALKIVDPNAGATLGANQKGEVCVKADSLMLGYYKADSSTVFDKEHFLKTGDIGYYDDDGYLYIVDRIKEMFKYKTWHIVPSAIECILLEHPAVKDAVVFGVPCGIEGEIPTAWIVLREKLKEITAQEIEDFANGKLSETQKLRGGVTIAEDIPRTPTGKVIRREVRRIVIESLEK